MTGNEMRSTRTQQLTLRRGAYNRELNPQADASPGAVDSSHHHTMTILKPFEGKCYPRERKKKRENSQGNYVYENIIFLL